MYYLLIGKRDACGQFGPGSACCTDEILNSYAALLGDDLKRLIDTELIHLSRIFAVAKQQTDGKLYNWLNYLFLYQLFVI